MRSWAALLLALSPAVPLAGCATGTAPAEASSVEAAPASPPADSANRGERTQVTSDIDAQRLLANKGVTLQWIDWNTRGTAIVTGGEGLWTLRGAQTQANGPGRLFLDGRILEIGPGYFTFEGVIRITDTPDGGRTCEARKTWHFAVTQNRPYYRLREFEWCDGLTDYVDIYF